MKTEYNIFLNWPNWFHYFQYLRLNLFTKQQIFRNYKMNKQLRIGNI